MIYHKYSISQSYFVKTPYHNDTGPGGNKKKIRRILPDKSGEEFNSKITNLLSNVLQKSVFKMIRKNNR